MIIIIAIIIIIVLGRLRREVKHEEEKTKKIEEEKMDWQRAFWSMWVHFYWPWFSTHLPKLYDCTALWSAINFLVTYNNARGRRSGTVVYVIRTLVHRYIQLCYCSSTLLWFLNGIAVLILKGISFFSASEDLASVISQGLIQLPPPQLYPHMSQLK